MPRRNAYAVVATLVTTALLSAGCGSGKSTSTASTKGRTALATAVSKTARLSTARFAFRLGVDIKGLPDTQAPAVPMQFSGEGLFDYKAKKGDFTLDLSAAKEQAGGKVPAGLEKLHLVLAGDTAYLELPPAKAPAGKKWAKVTPQSGAKIGGLDVNELRDFLDPGFTNSMLKGLDADKLTDVGTETVRGTSTTHYRLSVDLGKAGDPNAKNLLGQMSGFGEMPADVWIGSDGVVRRFQTSIDLAKVLRQMFEGFGKLAQGTGATTTLPRIATMTLKLTMTSEVWDLGTPVHVSVPSADEVVDGSQVSGLFGG